jgi:GT2 family glycosyltransferase
MPPRHAVIIPHFNDPERLARCLEALSRNDLTDTEVVVVDNASPASPAEVVARHAFARLVVEPGRGAAVARNRGVAETTGEAIFFLDADCVPAADWVAVARSAVGGADIVGGAIDVFDETPPPRSGAEAFETVFAFNYRDYILNKHFSVTANLLTTRRVFEAVGPFINGLSEDEEWCLRARSKGFRIALEERLRVGHPTRPDWPSLVRKWKRLNREMFGLRVQRRGNLRGRLEWLLRGMAMPLSAIAHVPRILRNPRLSGWGERLAAIATLVRLRALRAVWMIGQAVTGRA